MNFEWDSKKDQVNKKKHNVSFDEAKTVFYDVLAAIFDDELSSFGEYRELIIGHSDKKRLLIVSFTERQGIVRIISSRLATTVERKDYEANRR